MGRAYIGNFKGPRGETGNSAYQSAQAGGYTGTETEFEQAVTKFASSYFGYFPTLEDLKTNHPTGVQGTFAIVNREIAIWSPADQNWIIVNAETMDFLKQTKADKNNILQTNLYAQYAYDLKNPAIAINDVAIFDNPPLTQMSKLDYHISNYTNATKPKNAPPASTANAYWWQILTFTNSVGRALQIATQAFQGANNGRMFLRTRHVDNNDFTQWQAWKEVATCYCADMEWKALPMVNGWINATGDPAAALKYRKGADGKIIYVQGYIKQPNTLTNDNRTFAYLPENYRPKNYWWTNTVHESKEGVASIRVNLNGQMYVTNVNANTQAIVNSAMPVCLTIPI